ncbi:unnamed protein product [Effrenium voratum]|nr:unnamed protein product [Effrenium voratum]
MGGRGDKGGKGGKGDKGEKGYGRAKGEEWGGDKGGKGEKGDKGYKGGKGDKGYKGGPGNTQGSRCRAFPPAVEPRLPQERLSPGEIRTFARGVLGTGELYFELRGSCVVHLAVPAPTKLSGTDHAAFAGSGPVEVGGRRFGSVQALLQEVINIRTGHSELGRFVRLKAGPERLMRHVFAYHPEAERKLKGLQFIQVGPNAQSCRESDTCFFVMRSEEDGDDISYIKCLRALAASGPSSASMQLPLVTLSLEEARLLVDDRPALEVEGASCGLQVDLKRRELHILSAKGGAPQRFFLAERKDLPLQVVLEPSDHLEVTWAPPFRFARSDDAAATNPASARACLEALMREHAIAGDLSALAPEELQRIASQVLARSLDSARVWVSSKGAERQKGALLGLARQSGSELSTCQLQESQRKLEACEAEKEALETALARLREENLQLQKALEAKRTEQPGGAAESGQPWQMGVSVMMEDMGSMEAVEALRRQLCKALPDPAGLMLKNTLRLMCGELYSGPKRALWELVQNADDCQYEGMPCLHLVKFPSYLWIEYNEAGFSLQDVQALCSVGASTKGPQQTGEKGVGFKSAFVLSAQPHVVSNPFQFYFDESADCPLPQVTPQPILGALPRPVPGSGTAVYLPLRRAFPDLLEEIVPEALLFLRRLQRLQLLESDEPSGASAREWSFQRKDEAGVCVVEDGKAQHQFVVVRKDELAVAFPLDRVPAAALVCATLPLQQLPQLHTPMDAPFDLTASREALQESPRNLELRDALAELWLQAVQTDDRLAPRAFLLQPGLEASPLLRDLQLEAAELEGAGLALPTKEFLRCLPGPAGDLFEDFAVRDLLGLLEHGGWEVRGNAWRQQVVGALAARISEVDLSALRKAKIFPVDGAWLACSEERPIYLSLPAGAPPGLVAALDAESVLPADGALLRALGCGEAGLLEVASAVVRRGLGLTVAEDLRFSWSNLAFLGRHWHEILSEASGAHAEQMEEYMRSALLPNCSGKLLHAATELQCPYLLGCKSTLPARELLAEEPPGAGGTQARLFWELTFLRLGARCCKMREVLLPEDLLADEGAKELDALLQYYEARGFLPELRGRCRIRDRAGRVRAISEEVQQALLAPDFEPLLGPEFVVDVGVSDVAARWGQRLLGLQTVSALAVAQRLGRAAAQGVDTLGRAYTFLAEEQRQGWRGAMDVLKGGVWIDCEGVLQLRQVCEITWEDVERQIALWPKADLQDFFRSLGVEPAANSSPTRPKTSGQAKASQASQASQASKAKPKARPDTLGSAAPLPQLREEAEGEGGAAQGSVRDRGLEELLDRIYISGVRRLRPDLPRQELAVERIRFTQDSVGAKFAHGPFKSRLVTEVAKDLQAGAVPASSLELMVVKVGSAFWTLNNRSLLALRLAAAQRPLMATAAVAEPCPATARFARLYLGLSEAARVQAQKRD